MSENCTRHSQSPRMLNHRRRIAYRDLVRNNAPGPKLYAYFFRALRVKVAQPQMADASCSALVEEELDCVQVASVLVVMPEELGIGSEAR